MENKSNNSVTVDRREMLKYIPKESRSILDVGCYTGNFGMLLKQSREVEVWGVELDQEAASVARQKLDHVISSSFDSGLSFSGKKFDCIVFNDVLEHMVNPDCVLLYAKELLQPGGIIVCSIPNVRYIKNVINFLILKDWNYTDSGILDRTHLRFFTRKSMVSLFLHLDYKIQCVEGINSFDEATYLRPKSRPILSFLFFSANFFVFNQIEDMRYLNYCIVARPIDIF